MAMGKPGIRLDRLLALADELNVSPYNSFPQARDVPRPFIIALKSDEDENAVEEALGRTRTVRFNQKKHFLRKKPPAAPSNDKEARKEATATLEALVRQGCSPVAAAELLEKGADVNFSRSKSTNLSKRVRSKDQEDVRSNLFKTAVQTGNVELVSVLARAADQANCDQALHIAIEKEDVEMVKVLTASGADPNLHAAAFQAFVRSGSIDMACALSSGSCAPSKDLVTSTLYDAVKSNQLRTIQVLLWRGADANIQDPSALLWAARLHHGDALAALCTASCKPSAVHLSKAIAAIYGNTQSFSSIQLRLVEILLAAGAEGPEVADTIIAATKRRQHDLVQLLVEYSTFDNDRSLTAIKSAMELGDLVSFQGIFTGRTEQIISDELLLFLPTTRASAPPDTRLEFLELIVAACPSKAAMSKSLLDAAEHEEIEGVRILLQKGALVDYNKGEALVIAVRHQHMDLLQVLVEGRPSVNTLSRAFTNLEKVPMDSKLSMAKLLLDAGATGSEVDEALLRSLTGKPASNQDYEFIQLLVSGGADVNVKGGACLTSAIEKADAKALKILLSGMPQPEILSSMFTKTLGIGNIQHRYQIMELLLIAGARGSSVAHSLIEVIEEADHLMRFVKLLLEQGDADVNHNNGESVYRAIMDQNTELLRLLMNHRPCGNTLSRAMVALMTLDDHYKRLEICGVVLEREVPASAIAEALISSIKTHPADYSMVEKLLNAGASIDHCSGQAMQIALVRPDEDLLQLLLKTATTAPQPTTLARILIEALKIQDDRQRYRAAKMLLSTSTPLAGSVLGPLLHQTFNASDDLRLLNLFLRKGASVDCDNLRAIQKAIDLNQALALEHIIGASPSGDNVQRAFQQAWNSKDSCGITLMKIVTEEMGHRPSVNFSHYLVLATKEDPCSEPLVSFLLQRGASVGFEKSHCMRNAVDRVDISTLEILLEHARRDDIAAVFETATKSEQTWINPAAIAMLSLLIEKGAFGEPVDQCLCYAVEKYASHPNAPQILDLLVTHEASSASSDYLNGYTFEHAARTGNEVLIETLLQSRPSVSTLNNALPYIFRSAINEHTALRIVETLLSYAREKLFIEIDLNLTHKELRPVLFLCVERWPNNILIPQTLLRAGAFCDQAISDIIEDDFEAQTVTVSLWAIVKLGSAFTCSVLRVLLDGGANPNFITQASKLTLLVAAVRQSRASIAKILLSHSADPSVTDHRDHTPLCYASLRGDVDIMTLLIDAGAPKNDGSLHEAGGNCKPKAAKLLVEAGHDPNYPSRIHSMRPPMEHLLRQEAKTHPPAAIQEMFELLVQAGARGDYVCDGKSLLIMALDIPNSNMITPALLSAFMGDKVNMDFNLYRNGGFVFSPTSYLMKCQQHIVPSLKRQLLQALYSYSCRDIWYSENGPQPDEYTRNSAPRHIVEKEDARRRRIEQIAQEDEERERRIALETEERERLLLLDRRDADERKRLAQEAHQARLAQDQEQARERNRLAQESAAVQLHLQAKENAQAQQFALTSREAELLHQREQDRLRLQYTENEKRLMIEERKLETQLQLEYTRGKYDLDRSAQNHQDEIEAKRHNRGMQLLKEQKAYSKAQLEWNREESRRLDRQKSVLKLEAGRSQQPRLLSYGGDDPD